MPPRAKFTKAEVLEAALGLVREEGMEALSARSLAARLGTSTAPIFTAFSSLEELKRAVEQAARQCYADYIKQGLSDKQRPFKEAGLMYIRFAKEEKHLFKLLFLKRASGREQTHYFPDTDENNPIILEAICQNYNLSEDRARRIYNHMSVYALGLALAFSQEDSVFSEEDASALLSELFFSLYNYYKGE